MIGFRETVTAVASAIALAGCAQKAPSAADSAADQAAIQATSETWQTAYNAPDPAGVVALYADDAVVSPPGVPAARGRDAIREFFNRDIAASVEGGYDVQLTTGDIGIAGDTAWRAGSWIVTDGAGTTVDAGKDLAVYRKTDGKWLILHDMWNSDNPATPPAAPEPPVPPAAPAP